MGSILLCLECSSDFRIVLKFEKATGRQESLIVLKMTFLSFCVRNQYCCFEKEISAFVSAFVSFSDLFQAPFQSSDTETITSESAIMKRLNHPHIVKCFDVLTSYYDLEEKRFNRYLVLIQERMEKDSLKL